MPNAIIRRKGVGLGDIQILKAIITILIDEKAFALGLSAW